MSYNITYQNKKEEYFDNAKEFAEKYMKLKKAGELKTIDSVRMEICNFWYPQSEYGIKMILKKGLEKNSGYLLKLITKDNEEEKYLTHDDFLTREKQNAYIFSDTHRPEERCFLLQNYASKIVSLQIVVAIL